MSFFKLDAWFVIGRWNVDQLPGCCDGVPIRQVWLSNRRCSAVPLTIHHGRTPARAEVSRGLWTGSRLVGGATGRLSPPPDKRPLSLRNRSLRCRNGTEPSGSPPLNPSVVAVCKLLNSATNWVQAIVRNKGLGVDSQRLVSRSLASETLGLQMGNSQFDGKLDVFVSANFVLRWLSVGV